VLFVLVVLRTKRTRLRKRSVAESGSHFRRSRRGARSPAARREIFAAGEIPGSATRVLLFLEMLLMNQIALCANFREGSKILLKFPQKSVL